MAENVCSVSINIQGHPTLHVKNHFHLSKIASGCVTRIIWKYFSIKSHIVSICKTHLNEATVTSIYNIGLDRNLRKLSLFTGQLLKGILYFCYVQFSSLKGNIYESLGRHLDVYSDSFYLNLFIEGANSFKLVNPIALRIAKTPLSFSHSECNWVKLVISIHYQLFKLLLM